MYATKGQTAAFEVIAPAGAGTISGGGGGGGAVAVVGGDLPVAQLKARPWGAAARALNVVVAFTAFVILLPLMIVLAVLIKLSSPGPVFYTQDRVGMDRRHGPAKPPYSERRSVNLGGRPFRMYKFRTMRVGAEKGTGPVWAKPGDTRVTWLGRFLRRTRIDELPQLWNVIRGDMNIVGPRPERPTLVAYLCNEIDSYTLRHRVRPGITGWAQVNQAYDTTLQSVRSKLMFDLDYIQRRSVFFDLRIMLVTIPAVIRKRGGW